MKRKRGYKVRWQKYVKPIGLPSLYVFVVCRPCGCPVAQLVVLNNDHVARQLERWRLQGYVFKCVHRDDPLTKLPVVRCECAHVEQERLTKLPCWYAISAKGEWNESVHARVGAL